VSRKARPADVQCYKCVAWNAPTEECRIGVPEWMEGYANGFWPKTKADDWCGYWTDDWNELRQSREQT
jgi:hypothetical protein